MPVLYQWNGKSSNRIEKGNNMKNIFFGQYFTESHSGTAMDLAKRFRDKERVGGKLIVMEEGREEDHFWKILGGKGPVSDAESVEDDLTYEKSAKSCIYFSIPVVVL
jgi:hypothetical protein